MPQTSPVPPLKSLLARATAALNLTNHEMGKRFYASRNTVGRWQKGTSEPAPGTVLDIARAVFPANAELAADLALSAGETLETLGLVVPLPAAAPAPRGPSLPHLADMVLCAVAEAGNQSPSALRPLLVTAFERADAVGLSVKDVLAGLRAGGPAGRDPQARPPAAKP
jgi:hypothetical protein